MDYSSMENYADEPKKPSKVGRVFFWIAAAIIASVYLIIFVRIYMTRDAVETKIVYFSKHAQEVDSALADGESFDIYILEPRDLMSSDGLIQLRYVTYLQNSDELQITVKYKKVVGEQLNDNYPFEFGLTNAQGVSYSEYKRQTFVDDDYFYVRLCYEGVSFDFVGYEKIDFSLYDKTEDDRSNPIITFCIFDKQTSASQANNYTREDL